MARVLRCILNEMQILLGVRLTVKKLQDRLPSLSLIPQFSTTISEAKLTDNSFRTFSCIDSPISNPYINFTILLNWYSIRSSLASALKSFRVGKQGKTTTNKDNNISKMIALNYCHISPNMACFCKLMAQNGHKNGVTELH